MTIKDLPRVLCVDDEERVVQGLVPHLHKEYEVHTALSGTEGLQVLRQMGGAAVVVSDMRMPGMDGATFLYQVMQFFPGATRMLLTGEPGRDAAIAAVNQAQIFRFLAKPCPAAELKAAVEAGVLQHHTVTTERTVLKETLVGCIKTLVDVLAIANPVAFGRSSRIKRLAMDFARHLGREDFWQLEAAAMLSQIGFLSLPADLVEKLYTGEPLTAEERILAGGAPEVARRLLENIPRLEAVAEILTSLSASDMELRQLGDGPVGVGSRILALVIDYYGLHSQGQRAAAAIKRLRSRGVRYGAELVERFAEYLGPQEEPQRGRTRKIALRTARAGMIIQQDVRTQLGTLLVPSGLEVTEVFLERMRHFGPELLSELVAVDDPSATSEALPQLVLATA
ncbi:MAG TPA: HD domain-containing phosphohydrolase [Steroidobacteraceae bacterium]|jgi:response regulator RpfG family c-di-GMP phosphodiesterase